MSAKTWPAVLLLCGGCSSQGVWPAFDIYDEGGRRPGAPAIAWACNAAEKRPGSADAGLSYVVRSPYCTMDRSVRTRVQCRFELGEAAVAPDDTQGRAERRVAHWRRARGSFTYSEQPFSEPNGDSWVESWTAAGLCRAD